MIAPVTSHDAAAGRQPRPELLQIGPVAQLEAGRLPRRLVQLFVGLSLYGASMGMLVRSALGLDPWDVFHYGVSLHVPWTFGTIVVVISFAVLLLRIPLRQMPGLGTIANAGWIGVPPTSPCRRPPSSTTCSAGRCGTSPTRPPGRRG